MSLVFYFGDGTRSPSIESIDIRDRWGTY